MDRHALIALAKEIARQHDLDPSLVCAIVRQESNWDVNASRYEPGYRWLWPPSGKLPKHSGKSRETEKNQQRTSWGLMQIMGAVARERGFREKWLTDLLCPRLNLEYGCRHLAWLEKRYGDLGTASVISAYNAGRPTGKNRIKYVEPVLVYMDHYRAGGVSNAIV